MLFRAEEAVRGFTTRCIGLGRCCSRCSRSTATERQRLGSFQPTSPLPAIHHAACARSRLQQLPAAPRTSVWAPPLAAGARALASPPHAPATPDRQLHRPSPHYPPSRMAAPEPGRRPSLQTTAKGAAYSPPKPDPASTDGAAASVPPVPRRLCPAPLLVRLTQTRSGARSGTRSCSDATRACARTRSSLERSEKIPRASMKHCRVSYRCRCGLTRDSVRWGRPSHLSRQALRSGLNPCSWRRFASIHGGVNPSIDHPTMRTPIRKVCTPIGARLVPKNTIRDH
jgi:hypothetical protein